MAQQKRITIIEKDLFVSQDMHDIFKSRMPTSLCEIFSSVEDARAAAESNSPDLIVVSADHEGKIDASESDVMWLVNSRVIAIDPRITNAPPGWAQLQKPFTETQLLDAAKALLASGSGVGERMSP